MLPVTALTPHPQNYRSHPEAQLRHICESLRQHGFYRNVVIARDGTILAGHGVVLAAKMNDITHVPTIRVDLEPTDSRALKILTGDNELGRFAEDDDRMLTELLREIRETDPTALLGTGYDDSMLAALVMVTRPAHEIANLEGAGEWLGLPEYHETDGDIFQLVVTFTSEEDRAAFVEQKSIDIIKAQKRVWSARWPISDREDADSIRFTEPSSEVPLREKAKPLGHVAEDLPALLRKGNEQDLFAGFLNDCSELGLDAQAIGKIAQDTATYIGGSAEARKDLVGAQVLEARWYEALARGEIDWSVYESAWYLGELWACWVTYSRLYLTALYRAEVVAEIGNAKRVVDLGCGAGFSTAALQMMFPSAKVNGTNLPDTVQMQLAERLAERYGFRVEGSAPPGPTDLLFASEYFEHIQAPVEHLQELVRTLEPRIIVVANSFDTRAIGHFESYQVDGETMPAAALSRRFTNELRNLGYTKAGLKLWNNRPSCWKRA